MMNKLEQKIEAYLFYENSPVSFKKLSKIFKKSEKEIVDILHSMISYYEGRGIKLVFTRDEAMLTSFSEISEIIESSQDEESLLSKQALETLAIILYKGKVSKQEIDYIRGVNSQFILRNLLLRDLIKKEKEKGLIFYFASPNLFRLLGIQKEEELPLYNEFKEKIKEIISLSSSLEENEKEN